MKSSYKRLNNLYGTLKRFEGDNAVRQDIISLVTNNL